MLISECEFFLDMTEMIKETQSLKYSSPISKKTNITNRIIFHLSACCVQVSSFPSCSDLVKKKYDRFVKLTRNFLVVYFLSQNLKFDSY